MSFARKMPEFYMIIARKIFSLLFLGWGHVPSLPPVSYAYGTVIFYYPMHVSILGLYV